jgi:hypothetical protein
MGGAYSTMERQEMHTEIFRRPEEKRSLGRPGCIWQDILKLMLRRWWKDADWIDPAKDRDMVMNSDSIKAQNFMTCYASITFPRSTSFHGLC